MRFVALLRGIANVPMAPLREKLETLGYTDVESFGASGNLLFTGAGDATSHERRITRATGRDAFVRGRPRLEKIRQADPYAGRARATIMFLDREPPAAAKHALAKLDLKPPRPVLAKRELYYVDPILVSGRKTPVDVEKLLGVKATFRTSRVVAKLSDRLSG